MVNQESVLDALRVVIDPDLHRDIVSLGFVKDLKVHDNRVSFALQLTTPACPVKDQLKQQAEDAVKALGADAVEVNMTFDVRPHAGMTGSAMLAGVKNVVPVASGKGGVGKSTVSANLAVALSKTGAKVGLLDADVYGPSIPTILGITDTPKPSQHGIQPVMAYGVRVISAGFFIRPDQAVVWRGPMLAKMIEQFLSQVDWGELDYLIVDLPPGTGDVQLTLCQRIPLTGALIVTTPQPVAVNIAASWAAVMYLGSFKSSPASARVRIINPFQLVRILSSFRSSLRLFRAVSNCCLSGARRVCKMPGVVLKFLASSSQDSERCST
jgi:ATP-binding protein involved in chromosome partitioning